MKNIFTAVTILFGFFTVSGQTMNDVLIVDDDIKLLRLTDDVYAHVSIADFGRFGRISSNGLVVIEGEVVIPGHGESGGMELVSHTLSLLEQHRIK